jgi:hypothetical protein
MNSLETSDALDFDDNEILHHQIQTITATHKRSSVVNWKRLLAFVSHPVERKFVAQTVTIGRLEQAGTECPVDLNRCADDCLAER